MLSSAPSCMNKAFTFLLLLRSIHIAQAHDVLLEHTSLGHVTSSISASKVTFSLHDIEETSTLLPPGVTSIRHSLLTGSFVVPCLILAIMVVSAITLTALFTDDEDKQEDLHRLHQHMQQRQLGHELPIRIPLVRRQRYVMETIREQPCNDVESTTFRQ